MNRQRGSLTAYLTAGGPTLEPHTGDAVPITVRLEQGVRISLTRDGDRRLYQDRRSFGVPLQTALLLGWCWIEE